MTVRSAPRTWPFLLAATVGAGLLLGGWVHLEQRRAQLETLERQAEELEARLGGIERRNLPVEDDATRSQVFRAASVTLAAAELQSRLAAMIGGAGGELRSVTILPAEDREPFRLVRLRTVFGGDHAALRDLLLALEEHRPPVFADAFSVRAREGGRKLAIELEISALVRIGEDAAR